MNRALAAMLILSATASLGGCATSEVNHHGTIASRGEPGRHVVARDCEVRVSSSGRSEVSTPVAGPREGTPTPEPAAPPPDTRLAGPTPQVPIPVVGMPMRPGAF